MYLYFKKV